MIVAEGVCKKYGKTQALDGMNLHVKEGTIHGLVGARGSGKSTAMRIFSTLVRPDKGSVKIMDKSRPGEIRGLVGLAPQVPRLHLGHSIRKEISLAAKLRGRDKAAVEEVFERLGLKEVADQSLKNQSDGFRRRVSLALALVHDPPVLLLDEPLTGVGPGEERQLKDTISGLEDKTILLSCTEISQVEDFCNNITILKDGGTVFEGEIDELRKRMGKTSLELRISGEPEKLLEKLSSLDYVLSISAGKNWAVVGLKDRDDIPDLIRKASAWAKVLEARPTVLSLDEVINQIKKGG